MPKEVTHWLIADEVCKHRTINISPEYRNVVLLGAVFHDVLYYYIKRDKEILATLPDKFHGSNKEDSFYFVEELINLYNQADKPDKAVVRAFTIGFASHIFVDINFHPFVYYMTGNSYDKDPVKRKIAVQKHREIECVIDCCLEKDANSHKAYDISAMYKDARQYLEVIFSNGIEYKKYGVRLIIDDILVSYKNFNYARKLFINGFLVKIMAFSEPLLPKSLQAIKQLSYHQHKYYTPSDVTGELTYFDTVTNEPHITTLQAMKERAVYDTLEFCHLLPAFFDGTAALPIGPSLETGQVRSSVYDMKYFHTGS